MTVCITTDRLYNKHDRLYNNPLSDTLWDWVSLKNNFLKLPLKMHTYYCTVQLIYYYGDSKIYFEFRQAHNSNLPFLSVLLSLQ